MKFFVAIAVALFVASCDALFFGHGSGSGSLSGNLQGHSWLNSQPSEAPVIITEAPVVVPEAPVVRGHGFSLQGQLQGLLKNHRLFKKPAPAPEVIPEEPVVVPESKPAVRGHGFSLQGQLQGLLKNHRLLANLNKQPATPAEIVPDIIAEPVKETAPVRKVSAHGNIQGLLKNHRLFSGSSGGFQAQGSLQGLLKNHRLFGGATNKNQAATTTDDPFGSDNTGFSVSTGESGFQEVDASLSVSTGESASFTPENVDQGISELSSGQTETNTFSETAEIPEPSPIVISDAPASSGGSLSGHFSASGSGLNLHKMLGGVVDAKMRLLEQAKNQVSSRFDNHIRNLDKLKVRLDKNQVSSDSIGEPRPSSFDGQFSLNAERRY